MSIVNQIAWSGRRWGFDKPRRVSSRYSNWPLLSVLGGFEALKIIGAWSLEVGRDSNALTLAPTFRCEWSMSILSTVSIISKEVFSKPQTMFSE